MASRLSILLPLLALANVPQAAANYENYYERGFGGYGDAFNERVGPFDANSTEFLKLVDASNATGIFKIPGYDVSKPYPGTPTDGWTLKLAAVDVSHPPQEWYTNGVLTSDAMVGYSLTIQAPDALLKPNPADGTKLVNTDPTWGMCIWNFGSPGHRNHSRYNNPTNKPLAEDGSCAGFLSDECIAALEKNLRLSYSLATKGRYGSPLVCQQLSTPDACGEYGPGNAGSSVPSYGGVPIPFLNGSVTTTDGWEFQKDLGDAYNSTKDLQEFWDSMVVNYWVVVTAMINATVDNRTMGYERNPPLSRVSCVAPNGMGTGKAFTFSGATGANVQNGGGGGEGSGTKTGDGKNSGAGLVSPARWAGWATLALGVGLGGWML
jgi:hypothetical protein